jgi:hypothetical protein
MISACPSPSWARTSRASRGPDLVEAAGAADNPKVTTWARGALLVLAGACAAGCRDRGVNDYWSGYLVVEDASARRVAAGEPSTIRLNVTLHNTTTLPINNVHEVRFVADKSSADFDLFANFNIGCSEPWDVPPGGSKVVAMNVSFILDPATFTVACAYDAATDVFVSSSDYQAPRVGGPLPADFAGPLLFDIRGTIDGWPCTSDKCPSLVSASASVPVSAN